MSCRKRLRRRSVFTSEATKNINNKGLMYLARISAASRTLRLRTAASTSTAK